MTKPEARPNVLFIIADDHRYGAIHAQGDPIVETPVLDGLMAQGVSFDRTYHFGGLTGGVCVPARACLMAGANPFRALASKDLADHQGLRTINPAMPTLPETFRKAGYHTYHVGKWHNDTASFHRSFAGGAKIFIGGMSADYCGMISHLDAWIGRIPQTLDETGLAGNTIVVYTADHGLAVGQHGLFGKQNLYEHSARVPCILRGPGLPSGRRVEALTYTPDLYPTLC